MDGLHAAMLGLRGAVHVPAACGEFEADVDADPDESADRALLDCATAARLHPFSYTHTELRVLYGRAASPGGARLFARPPFERMLELQVRRAAEWHARVGAALPLVTRLRLAAAYAGTGDAAPAPESARLRAIAGRAGVHSPVRVAALDTFCSWYGDGVDALRFMTRFCPPYSEIVTAFSAELQLLSAA